MRIRTLLTIVTVAATVLFSPPGRRVRGDPPAPRVQAKAGDLTVYVRAIQRAQYVSRQFTSDGAIDGAGYYGVPHCYLTLGFEGARPGDRYRVAGLNPTGDATDDRGEPVSVWSQVNQDETEGGVTALLTLPDLAGTAKYVDSLDGVLSLFASADPVRIEVPWPAVGQISKASRGEINITASDARKVGDGVSIGLRVDSPERSMPEWNLGARGGTVTLLDDAGQTIATDIVRSFSAGGGSGYRSYRLVFSGVPKAPARIAATVVIRSGPITSVPFHLERIPLPDFQKTPVTTTRPKTTAADAGSLLSRVVIAGRPAGAGTLVIGLRPAGKPAGATPSTPATGSALSWAWSEVPTDAAGTARLERVTPGRHLVRRYWRPASGDGASAPDPFAWRNSLTQVEVASKQESALAPLTLEQLPRR